MIKAVIFDLYETLITEWISDKYYSSKCAADLGIEIGLYRSVWESCHKQMDIGADTYSQVLMKICAAANLVPAPGLLDLCVSKRVSSKNQCFAYIDKEILKMLGELKSAGIKLALCSNCSQDEVGDFYKSDLAEYFDAVIFSYQAGVTKPDEKIYKLIVEKLGVLPSECLYVGDGGSLELYGAQTIGMKSVRAMWFLNKYAKEIELMPFDAADKPELIYRFISL